MTEKKLRKIYRLTMRTVAAIQNCDTLEQFKRLCYVGERLVEGYIKAAGDYVQAFVDYKQYESDVTKEQHASAINDIFILLQKKRKDVFLNLLYRMMLRLRRA